ncbi:DUF2163 domain-containing protein [Sulfitobacter donghicola]|uniref:Gene transfer agent protein n=1 Tax=Sulfitobacter donghicola DSW-25 = KCTC 12864 = JCM 14565 TaxID=1300350 RepID=A0A073IXU8_9RHOB|nr:DUF2163 domain-containing protein [Sulfitobacter donghicola]KEJ90212.1 gene transfer agent protein [Sulfitobacter donghicola DSW-25 = KCTC 12864 = JCM 14565]KIN66620.1 putative GTA protein [Sulfitobacter donghicola DSW-25 = KCTC 12864 = JCM 14565]
MADFNEELAAHLEGGLTTVCHAWAITRKDGEVFAFTDHDMPLSFAGLEFRADTGLSALALAQSTGLSVDNSEALGALSDVSLREDEIEQGRFDGAEVRAWKVNWADPSQHWLNFRGHLGELIRADGGFRAELRGLTEELNRPLGRVYQKPCSAVLGDGTCRFNLAQDSYSQTLPVQTVEGGRRFAWQDFLSFDADWFTRGRLEILDGPAQGLWGTIKSDRIEDNVRIIELWEPIRGDVATGTQLRLVAGCDKRSETCRLKFNNFINFQGFPDLPGEDWVVSVPSSTNVNDGGSLR